VPYSENARLTEHFDVARMRNGDELLVVTSIVEDARFLAQPFIVSTQFKKQPGATGWDPTPCSSTW
jgi:F0F1-type ATP synthase beta subunit